ncbi:MAG TPA: hypothetical protein PK872_08330 [Ferruginibacter sp.]|nr:hypothetical protein [Ferruginibacter sp.]
MNTVFCFLVETPVYQRQFKNRNGKYLSFAISPVKFNAITLLIK